MAADFDKVLALVTSHLVKRKFDAGIVTSLSGGALKGIPVIETGIPQLDVALGVGGIPRGRVIEVYGPESAGKTTLCLKFLSQAQETDVCGLVDAEHSFDPAWAKSTGVNIKKLMLSQPDCGEDSFEVVEEMIKSGAGYVMVDSVSALVPRAELEGNFGASHMGLQARMMSQAMRKLVGLVKKKNAILLFTNQIRMKIGVMYGNPETTPGGQALKFYASIRLDIRKGTQEKEDGDDKSAVTGMMTRIKVVKNKVAPPFKVCNARLDFKNGFDTASNLFECLVDEGIIEKRGSWFAIGTEQLGQGKQEALAIFRELPDERFSKMYFEYRDKKLNASDEQEISDEELQQIEAIRKKKKGKSK